MQPAANDFIAISWCHKNKTHILLHSFPPLRGTTRLAHDKAQGGTKGGSQVFKGDKKSSLKATMNLCVCVLT